MAELVSKQGVYEVPIADIEVGEGFNPRVLFQGIDELAESIKDQGQLTPCLVLRQNKKGKPPFFLIDGHRRLEAIKRLNGKGKGTVEVFIREPEDTKANPATDRETFLKNFTANMARNSYTSYEVAVALKKMQDEFKMNALAIQKYLNASKGFSKANINALIGCLNMHPKIVEAWSMQRPVCTLRNLYKWKSLTHEEQLEEYEAISPDPDSGVDEDTGEEHIPSKRGRASAEEGAEGGAGEAAEPQKKKTRLISKDKVAAALSAARKAARDEEEGAEYVVAALKFVLGHKDSVALKVGDVVFYDPRPAPDADGDEEDEEE